jgi:hypothetical protein
MTPPFDTIGLTGHTDSIVQVPTTMTIDTPDAIVTVRAVHTINTIIAMVTVDATFTIGTLLTGCATLTIGTTRTIVRTVIIHHLPSQLELSLLSLKAAARAIPLLAALAHFWA